MRLQSRLSIILASLQIYSLSGTFALAQGSGVNPNTGTTNDPQLRGPLGGTTGGATPQGSDASSINGVTPQRGRPANTPASPRQSPTSLPGNQITSPNPDTAVPTYPGTNQQPGINLGGQTPGQLTAPGTLDQTTLPHDAATEAADAGSRLSEGAESLLTPEERARSKEIPITPVPANSLIPIGNGKLPPIKLEATYNQPVGLREVLQIALENSLPIKINLAGWESQRYLYYGALGRFLPDFNNIFRVQKVYPEHGTTTLTRTLSTTVRFPVFQGGRIMYGALVSYHRMKNAQFTYSAAINDALLDVYTRYNQLLLNQVLLQVRLKSVELSRAQLRLNQQLKAAGTGTNFAVMQSTTQLALDRQALLQQEVAVRQSALGLAAALNMNVGINLMPLETRVVETHLVDDSLNIAQLTDIAVRNRPELRASNENRLAQTRQIQVAMSALMPTAQFFLTANRSEVERSGGGSSSSSLLSAASSQSLGSQAATGTSGNGVGGSPVVGTGVAGIGGANSVVIPAGGGGGSGISVGGGTSQSFTAGFDLNWNLASLGVPDMMATLSQRALARQAMLQYNQVAIQVLTQVRSSYLNTLTAQEQVDVTGEAVVAAQEGLRLANLRLQHGVGTNLELIQAQRDYITALINQAQAIINYNISQAQLQRDIGQISVASLTNEIRRPISHAPLQSKFFN